MAEEKVYSFNNIGTTEGEVRFGDVMKNNAKMAVIVRNIFPSSFTRSHYMGLQMTGKLAGSTINSAPACYQILCGEKPIDGVSFVAYAENGDMIIGAPKGRIRMFAQDIDIIASGNGTDTGWVNVISNAKVNVESGTVQLQSSDALSLGTERNLNLNVPGRYKITCGSMKVVEGADISPVTSPLGSGVNTIKQQLEGLKKLIESIA